MNSSKLAISGPTATNIEAAMAIKADKETAGYLFVRESSYVDPWKGSRYTKYTSRSFTELSPDDVISRSDRHITWKMDSFLHALRRSKEQDETICLVHSHPCGLFGFSKQEDQNESHLIEVAQKRNGYQTKLLSLIVLPDGRSIARLWINPNQHVSIDLFMMIGDRFRLSYPSRENGHPPKSMDRQALALGQSFVRDCHRLRIGVVGCGGTGSATAHLLALNGFGQLCLFDADAADETNMNRLHLFVLDDARLARNKARTLAKRIETMELGTSVRAFEKWINDEACRDALKSCDILFGCTDDHAGRQLLNRVAYFYNLPVIDMGLAIEVAHDNSCRMSAFDGRVTVIQPGACCLLCREVINPAKARDQALKMFNPEEFERRKQEAYVQGEGNPSPAVSTFTTSVATMAVEELTHRLQGFRGKDGGIDQRLRKFHLVTDRKQGQSCSSTCPVCGVDDYWGLGDVAPFLDQVS